MSKNIFITGTGTDIGKTYITGLIIKKLRDYGLNAGYYKAAVSGNIRDSKGNLVPGDIDYVNRIGGINGNLKDMCPYVYENALSPHLAAKIEGNPVELDVVKEHFNQMTTQYDYICVEGSGGIVCPIRYDEKKIWLEDIVKELNLDSIVIADAGLGTINHVVMTVEYMRQHDLSVKGIVLNNFHDNNVMEEDNKMMIEDRLGVEVIACVRKGDNDLDINPEYLSALFK